MPEIDMADPLLTVSEVAERMRVSNMTVYRLIKSGQLAAIRVGKNYRLRGNDVEQLMYGFSIFHCLPVGMADNPSVGTGTVMRPDTLRGYARAAGFADIEILPLENFFFNFYRLVP